jgi:hypothetical protein
MLCNYGYFNRNVNKKSSSENCEEDNRSIDPLKLPNMELMNSQKWKKIFLISWVSNIKGLRISKPGRLINRHLVAPPKRPAVKNVLSLLLKTSSSTKTIPRTNCLKTL